MTLVYKIVGEGTRELAEMAEGEKLRMLTGLGNGYDLKSIPEEVTLVGGGVGVPPLYGLCEELVRTGKHPSVVLGFQTKEDVFYRREFEALGVSVQVVTEDGREGIRGRVNDALSEKGYLCACGPLPMLRALVPFTREGQFSLEARMGCGFGACMGCSLETRNGAKRVCKEGPVFSAEEILWDRM